MILLRRTARLLVVLAITIPASARAGEPVRLATGGRAEAPIVISADASPALREVADDLAAHLERITGARFAVTTGEAARGIVLGTLEQFPDPALAKDLEIRGGVDGREAFAIRTGGGRVRLTGATDLGASHAAYRFLEILGCRWLFPAPQWHVIPSKPVLEADVNESDRPALLSRRIWWGYGSFDKKCQADYEAWARRNRMASSRRIWCSHAWQSIIRDNRKTFDEHPEYLALVAGKRTGEQFCVSNPAVRRIAADWALGQLRRRPELDMVTLEPSDGGGHCECDACRRLGSMSDRIFGLANEVARAVAREFPGKMVGLYAYNDHCEPPSLALEPNVYVQSTAGFIRGRYTFDELMEMWPKVCRNFGFYEYFSVWPWDFDMPPGGRGADVGYLRERIAHYASLGATSLDCESGNNWGLHGRGYCVANKLMWNPRADVDALLEDFYRQAFGPAAAVMRRYYERLDPGAAPLVGEPLLATALRDIQEASALAAGRPDVEARLDQLKQYQHYVRLRWEYDRATDKDVRRQLALAALTHVYRTRYTYMNHWAAMRQEWVASAAKNLGQAAWTSEKPWEKAGPCTHEETERLFQEDLARFQPQPMEEVAFSADLVPAGLKTDHPADSSQKYQKGARYALFSRGGEPLAFTITTGLIAWYRDHPEARYDVADAVGKEVARGRLPQDGQAHPLEVRVPGPGLYWLNVEDQAAGWGLQAAGGQPVALALARGQQPSHLGQMQRMYFYVPKGTTEIRYFCLGRPHEICGPDGKVAAQVAADGKNVAVAVPAGCDGRAWSLQKLSLGRLWFYNVPNYLAASPDALLVPHEVAARDGLKPPG